MVTTNKIEYTRRASDGMWAAKALIKGCNCIYVSAWCKYKKEAQRSIINFLTSLCTGNKEEKMIRALMNMYEKELHLEQNGHKTTYRASC
jgi:hypothetical protein